MEVKRWNRIITHRNTFKELVARELKTKYAGSILGLVWAVLSPVLIAMVISFVFTKVMRIREANYPPFIICALLPWMFTANSLSEATASVVNNASLVKQFLMPKELIPGASVFANFINFLLGLAAVIPILIFFKTKIVFFLPLLPIALFLHFTFTAGLALLLASVNVYVRDATHLVRLGLLFWLWITPIFYSLKMVPEGYRWIAIFNPATPFIVIYRDILFEAKVPEVSVLLGALAIAAAALIIGYATFLKCEPSFAKKV